VAKASIANNYKDYLRRENGMIIKTLGTSYIAMKNEFRNAVLIAPYSPAESGFPIERTIKWLSLPLPLLKGLASGMITPDQFREEYYNGVLSHLDPIETIKDLTTHYGNNIVFLGYHADKTKCQRFFLGEWIESNTDYKVIEVTQQSQLYGYNIQEALNRYGLK
jgi:hypothetical protein